MIVIPELVKKITGLKYGKDYWFNYPSKERPPIRLLKAETGLPANILNVNYSVSLEFGVWKYIEVQDDTSDELHEENQFWIFFNEDANLDISTDEEKRGLPKEELEKMRDFVRKSFADKTSPLSLIMSAREKEWNEDVKEQSEKNQNQIIDKHIEAFKNLADGEK